MARADADERNILNHYNLTSTQPAVWPFDDDEDRSAVEELPEFKAKAMRRFTTIGRPPSVRGKQSDPARVKRQNVVQKDEEDPLGISGSVVKTLRYRGLPVEDDLKLRNQFLLSSTTFSPTRYLTEVHSDASTEDLMRGLQHLSQSIEQKSASLKVLVESNFERFVRAKATVDNVYREMRSHGAEIDVDKKIHSRQTSRNVPHFRSHSGAGNNQSLAGKPYMSEKRRQALLKESDYGTLSVKLPLLEANIKADEIWGPTLGDRGKEEELKAALSSLEANHELLELGAAIDDCAKRSDFETLVEEYDRIQRHINETRSMAEIAQQNASRLTDSELHRVLITARVWMDVQSKIEDVKRNLWLKLINSHKGPQPDMHGRTGDEHTELISVLLQLGTDENPISTWLQSHYDYLQNKITLTFERTRVELEVMRRRLLKGDKPNAKVLATFLKTASSTNATHGPDLDTPAVLRFWARLESGLDALLSANTGILYEVLEFWETSQGFIEGKAQRNLPVGANGQGRKHLRLSSEVIKLLQQAPAHLIRLIREQLDALFTGEPVEDISSLISPLSATPGTSLPGSPNTPVSAMTPSRMTRFDFKLEDIPVLTPRGDESWEKLAFWPPYSNSLSASTVLARVLTVIASSLSEMASVSVIKQNESQLSQLRSSVGDIRERINTSICSAWVADSIVCREFEDWRRSGEKSDITSMPSYFNAWESAMLANVQKIVYISDATGTTGAGSVIVPPSQRHVETVQRAFRNSMYKSFDGMMNSLKKSVQAENSLVANGSLDGAATSRVDSVVSDESTRKLHTIANFQHLRSSTIPALISTFETTFSTTVTSDSRVLRDSLSQMSSQLFKSYLKPTLTSIDALIHAGIGSPTYTVASTPKPTNAKPYIYAVLSLLVTLHTSVSQSTPTLTTTLLSSSLEHISGTLTAAFTAKPGPFPLATLTQATLDVEFLAQTLNAYTTDRCSELQGKIYLAMDEKTDNESRVALQRELPEMRSVLKRLREGTRGAFGCFRRGRRGGVGGVSGAGAGAGPGAA